MDLATIYYVWEKLISAKIKSFSDNKALYSTSRQDVWQQKNHWQETIIINHTRKNSFCWQELDFLKILLNSTWFLFLTLLSTRQQVGPTFEIEGN